MGPEQTVTAGIPTLVSLEKAAELLSMHYETFRRKRAKGELPYLRFYRVGGGWPKVSLESVREQLRRSLCEE